MSLLRFDATTQDWVIYAPERARRPKAIESVQRHPETVLRCPFCPGNESLTPPDMLRLPDTASGKWDVRVIPNKFALLQNHNGRENAGIGLFGEKAGHGAHEVLIESPDHEGSMGMLSERHIETILAAILRRYQVLREDPAIRAILVFKNHGEAAGTSIRHPHWQIVATPVVPRMHRHRHMIAQEYFDRTDHCLYCDLLEAELREGSRLIARNESFCAVAPYASHVAYQIRILPARHSASFENLTDEEMPRLAAILKEILFKLHMALGDPPFNLTLSTAPRGDENKPYFLWHMDILPRLSTPAGFELGSGMPVNTIMPEDAAARLRSIPRPE